MRSRLAALLTLGLAAAPTGPALAQSADILDRLTNDVTALTVNTPIWLAQHLPSMMAQSGLGAGIDLQDDTQGFSFGVVPLRVGLMNQFNQVGRGTDLLNLEEALPGNFPWPQFGITTGIGFGHGFELGLDVHFLPDLDIAGEDISVSVGLVQVAGQFRFRINEAKGALPAFIIGVGGSYYGGHMEVGAGFESPYTVETDQGTVEGTYTFSGAPRMAWSLYAFTPELRVAWKWGPLRPFTGVGLVIADGSVTGGTRLRATATIDRVAGEEVDQDPVVFEDRTNHYETPPARFTIRPHVGLDLVMGPVALTAQLDLAVMSQDEISADLGDAPGSFDPGQGGLLYNQASKSSQSAAALVGTVALRLQL